MFKQAKDFGVIKVDGNTIKLFTTQINCGAVINIGQPIKEARWSGNDLIVYLNNGKVRKYSSQYNYITV